MKMNRYYFDCIKSTVRMMTNGDSLVCIAADPRHEHEIGCVITDPIFPGSWIPLEGSVDINDIVLLCRNPK